MNVEYRIICSETFTWSLMSVLQESMMLFHRDDGGGDEQLL